MKISVKCLNLPTVFNSVSDSVKKSLKLEAIVDSVYRLYSCANFALSQAAAAAHLAHISSFLYAVLGYIFEWFIVSVMCCKMAQFSSV